MKIDKTTHNLRRLLNQYKHQIAKLIDTYGQPLHVFFIEEFARLISEYQEVQKALYSPLKFAFAVKSNPCRGAIRSASKLGMGADCASEYELQAALEEGITGSSITCNGNAKTDDYLKLAVLHEALIVIDNKDELFALIEVCEHLNSTANILLRFSGMPLSGLTSDDQSTAGDWTKFGFHIDEACALFELVRNESTLNFLGVSAHIGTQLSKPDGFTRLFESLFPLIKAAKKYALEVKVINIGGGFPASFIDDDNRQQLHDNLAKQLRTPEDTHKHVTWNNLNYGQTINAETEGLPFKWRGKAYWSDYPGASMLEYVLTNPMADGQRPIDVLEEIGSPELIAEPGRSITAPCGVTICQVMGTKQVMNHDLVLLNLGINNHSTNLIAPDIFPAEVVPAKASDSQCSAFLAGRLCFTGDMISKNKVTLNRLPARGEQLVIYHTGGYSADHFASNSCGYPRPAKVAIVDEKTTELWRAPENYQSVFGKPNAEITTR